MIADGISPMVEENDWPSPCSGVLTRDIYECDHRLRTDIIASKNSLYRKYWFPRLARKFFMSTADSKYSLTKLT
eukprot:UN08878